MCSPFVTTPASTARGELAARSPGAIGVWLGARPTLWRAVEPTADFARSIPPVSGVPADAPRLRIQRRISNRDGGVRHSRDDSAPRGLRALSRPCGARGRGRRCGYFASPMRCPRSSPARGSRPRGAAGVPPGAPLAGNSSRRSAQRRALEHAHRDRAAARTLAAGVTRWPPYPPSAINHRAMESASLVAAFALAPDALGRRTVRPSPDLPS